MAKKKKEVKARNSICLVMIVKNESEVIKRCLDSVKDYIDYWVICDTGSTDGTQNIIKDAMSEYGIEGELHESEWKDFGRNRTESLNLSKGKCDYRLIIDADDVLQVTDLENLFKDLTEDSYKIKIELGVISYFRTQLVRSNQDWKYVGVLHEYPEGPKDVELTEGYIEEAIMIASVSGDKKDMKGKDKYYNDALIFEKELVVNQDLEPGLKARYQFYLGQSYRDAGLYDRSIDAYQARVDLGGWPEEVYISLYMIGKMKHALGKPDSEVIDAFMKAWEYRPVRLEAPYNLIRFLASKKRYFYAFTIASMCIRMQPCDDILFVESDVWNWKITDEYSILAYYTGNIKEAFVACRSITKLPEFDEFESTEKERILKNLETFEKIYNEQVQKKKEEEAKSQSEPA
jgi:glycosyltransferase involved in cell wall biosynthesis